MTVDGGSRKTESKNRTGKTRQVSRENLYRYFCFSLRDRLWLPATKLRTRRARRPHASVRAQSASRSRCRQSKPPGVAAESAGKCDHTRHLPISPSSCPRTFLSRTPVIRIFFFFFLRISPRTSRLPPTYNSTYTGAHSFSGYVAFALDFVGVFNRPKLESVTHIINTVYVITVEVRNAIIFNWTPFD